MWAESHVLRPDGEKVLYPGTNERKEAESDQFGDEDVRLYSGLRLEYSAWLSILSVST